MPGLGVPGSIGGSLGSGGRGGFDIGLQRSFDVGRAARGNDDALSILGPSHVAAEWDASILSSLFQDSGLSTPVAANGNPVGGWKDQTATAAHLVQATAGLRASYVANEGGLPAVNTDGISQFLRTAAQHQTTRPLSLWIVYKHVTSPTFPQDYVVDGFTADTNVFREDVGFGIKMFVNGGTEIGNATMVADGVYEAICLVFDATGSLYQNNVLRLSGALGTAQAPELLTLAGKPDGTRCSNIRIRHIIAGTLSPTQVQLDAMQAMLKAKWNLA